MNPQDLIKCHEGYRGEVYEDSEGVLTCGWGHALHVGSVVSKEIAQLFFDDDFRKALAAAIAIEIDNGLTLNNVRHSVLVNMCFNMGYAGVCKFKKFIAAMAREDWASAAKEMLDSKWAKQVGYRADQLAFMMEKGI